MNKEPSYIIVQLPSIIELGSHREEIILQVKVEDTPAAREWLIKLLDTYKPGSTFEPDGVSER